MSPMQRTTQNTMTQNTMQSTAQKKMQRATR